MKKSFTILTLLLCSIMIYPQVFDWEWQNPKPTGTTYNDIVVFSSTNVMLFGEASVVLKTNNSGSTWEVSYADPDRREIEAAFFVDMNVGFVSGQDDLLMKTTNGGTTWTDLNPPTVAEDLWDVEFFDADTGYAVGSSGTILKTTDGGATFTSLSSPMTNTLYAVHIVSADNIFIGTASSSATQIVSQSTDYGVTWNNVTGSVANSVYSIQFNNANYGWLGCSSNKVFKTTDGAATWTQVADFGSSSNYAIFFEDTSNGYVPDSGGDVNKTTDGGATFTETKISTEILRAIGGGNVPPSKNLDALYIGGSYGTILYSADNGLTWQPKFDFVYQELQRRLHFVDSNTGYVCGGSTTSADSLGYILKTTDGGATWFDLGFDFNFQVYSFDVPTSDIIYVGRGNCELYKSTDAGLTFVQQTSPISGTTDYYFTDFFDADTGYAGGTMDDFVKTTDGGATWNILANGHGTSTVYDFAVIDGATLISVGASAKAYKSTDAGATWNPIAPGNPGSYFVVEFYDNMLGYIGGYDSPNPTLSKTTDGGDTWTPITFPVGFDAYGSIWGIGLPNATTIWLSDGNGNILYSVDAGVNWTAAKKFTQTGLYDISIVGIDMWLCGTGGAIVKGFSDPLIPVELTSFTANSVGNNIVLNWTTATETNNKGFEIERRFEGTSWTTIGFVEGNGTTTEISSYSYEDTPQENGILDYRLKQIDFDGTYEYSSIVEVSVQVPKIFELSQNYPNPFNPATTIEFNLPIKSLVTLKVYNPLGQEVVTIINNILEEGYHSIQFDASKLPSGIYLYELAASDFRSVKKMILMK